MRRAENKKVLIISAPSGAGKSTLVSYLLSSGMPLLFSVSATSRKPRGNEADGREYYFITAGEFRRRIKRDEFIEWQEVYRNHYYGTLRQEIDRIRREGRIPLFDVDVQGGINLKKIFGHHALSIFVMPPSVEELGRRLMLRGTDSPEKIAMRVEKAASEILLAEHFDTIIINDNLEKACIAVANVVREFIDRP
ncbi:MAG: guanylate kinase [Bacteroidales bacterium]|jgi:guanylate kinase|nr:guanylate kinase [Bacteroidales bacterium]NLD64124.1 guanylate kinase [Bacteroidales bacterium]HNT92942.1 guanylate kinase [Bacteroidales bacterium]HOO65334.1 guanylate kinase [Bacteroidales bacterium]HPE21466.1 guanylate kinase [Bacteroidales bacterium]